MPYIGPTQVGELTVVGFNFEGMCKGVYLGALNGGLSRYILEPIALIPHALDTLDVSVD